MTPLGWLGRKTSTQTNKQKHVQIFLNKYDMYHIRPNYSTYPYKCTVMQVLSLQIKINFKKIAFGTKEHTTDQKMGVSVLLRLFISSNEVCNTAYASSVYMSRTPFSNVKAVYFQLFYKSICCWYSFELPRQVEAIHMSTKQHMVLKRKSETKSHKHH